MNRRTLLGGLGMVWFGGDRGAAARVTRPPGGLPPPRLDQLHRPPAPGAPPSGGAAGTLRARQVIISGPGDSLLMYAPTAGAGNLIASDSQPTAPAPPLVDIYGNQLLPGRVSYFQATPTNFLAVQLNQGQISFYHATSEAGPWSFSGSMFGGQNGASPVGVTVETWLTITEETGPPVTPLAGGTIWVDATGHLNYKGPGGTNTVLAGP